MEISEIRKYMKEKKITQLELSKKSGIPLRTVNNILRGYTQSPRLDTMNAICEALGLPLELPTQPTVLNHDRRVIAIGHGAPREEYELSEEDAAIVRELINRLNQNKKQ